MPSFFRPGSGRALGVSVVKLLGFVWRPWYELKLPREQAGF